MRRVQIICLFMLLVLGQQVQAQHYKRIISLSGSITEVLDALGVGPQIIAADVTSDYPSYISQIPKISKNRTVTIESLSAFRPDLVLGIAGEVSQDIQQQLKKLNIPLYLVKQEFSPKGLENFVLSIGHAVKKDKEALILSNKIQKSVKDLKATTTGKGKKIVFIYARGAGFMSVSGAGTAVDAMIVASGNQNAMKGFKEFKTYNTEAIVAANPDVILLFDFGMSSLGGKQAILKMPGLKLTNAGKNQKIVSMDANLLNNYSVRLPQAITELQALIK